MTNSTSMSNSPMFTHLEALSVSGGRGRAACVRITEIAPELASAIRRAVPFLARKRISVHTEPARCIPFADLAADDSIVHASAFTARSAGASSSSTLRGLVLFDDVALARILDGVLGGDGDSTNAIATPSSAQSALASRIAGSMLKALGDVLVSRLRLAVEPTSSRDIAAGAAVVVPLMMDGGGTIFLALPLSAISHEDSDSEPPQIDSGIAAAMTDVELDVVAELGRVRLPLEALAQLAIGDVIRLSLPLDERARVCAGGATLFHGRPTASGHVVAVAIERASNEVEA